MSPSAGRFVRNEHQGGRDWEICENREICTQRSVERAQSIMGKTDIVW